LFRNLEPIRKLKGVEQKDVSGYKCGLSKPSKAEMRHEKAYHKAEKSELLQRTTPVVVHCQEAPFQANKAAWTRSLQETQPSGLEWDLVHPVDRSSVESHPQGLVRRLE